MGKFSDFASKYLSSAKRPKKGSKMVKRFNKLATSILDHYDTNYKINCDDNEIEDDDGGDIERFLGFYIIYKLFALIS